MSKREIISKDKIIQAVIVAETFGNEFIPMSDEIPLSLIPVLNKPLVEYTLEFLSLGGITEVFLYCSSHVDLIKAHIKNCEKEAKIFTLAMKTNVIVSDSCYSVGDCLRDLDAKGLIRGNFILLGPSVLSNIKLESVIKKHKETLKSDKGAAMTLICQEAGVRRDSNEDIVMATNKSSRVLFYKRFEGGKERRIAFPLEIFLENSSVSLIHNLKDTHIAVCSPSVLLLFSENFDFQTKDDFIRGLLINEEILDSRIYHHIIKSNEYGGAVTSWKMYQALNCDVKNSWIYPFVPTFYGNRLLRNDIIVDENCTISDEANIQKSIIGNNVTIGNNANIYNTIILPNTKIDDDVNISNSIIGKNCHIKFKCKISSGCILGHNVVIEKGQHIVNSILQSSKPENCRQEDIIGEHAYRLHIFDDDDNEVDCLPSKKFSHLDIDDYDNFSDESDDDDDHLSFKETSEDDSTSNSANSPIPDDTKLFFTEVIDSLIRGFEDKLPCDNLILEINSSRYAYNVTLKEVNFNVIKAILHMSLQNSIKTEYFTHLVHLLSYFEPISKNYIRNESAMMDCLQAIEEVAMTHDHINDKWVTFVVKYFYDKSHVNEDIIVEWFSNLNKKCKVHSHITPFIDWLQNAEEASSNDDE